MEEEDQDDDDGDEGRRADNQCDKSNTFADGDDEEGCLNTLSRMRTDSRQKRQR